MSVLYKGGGEREREKERERERLFSEFLFYTSSGEGGV